MVLVHRQVRLGRSRPPADAGSRVPRRVPASPQTPSAPAKHLGLCSTCNNAPECGMRGAGGGPVLSCEEFHADAPAAAGLPAAAPMVEEPSRLKGLCGNCDNRRTCTVQRPESGIWHCEEYQ